MIQLLSTLQLKLVVMELCIHLLENVVDQKFSILRKKFAVVEMYTLETDTVVAQNRTILYQNPVVMVTCKHEVTVNIKAGQIK